ncbi:DNA-binding transcriptional regulator, XRE-family HTH domain [Eubacterium aggregans]|uniref:DNA-binding transcriptional regulator, XRE-family HTH domain n=1 Tax=Eubacterium aggregans TaxID=81409 RepID=A0A1H3YVB4_9FIRM|nr:helix-turn-helix domain-containing protein [Eubacterium aggregans]SEA14964.1 DNA-binding transcriptional regulator, XRE-family HTH domain [Eubacterium aggregans]
MYRVLIGKMAEHGVKQKDLAEELGVSEKTIYNKIQGKTSFSWDEANKVRNSIEPGFPLEELFKFESENRIVNRLKA